MKKRTVIVTLELEADLPIKALQSKDNWQDLVNSCSLARDDENIIVRQVRAQVAQAVSDEQG